MKQSTETAAVRMNGFLFVVLFIALIGAGVVSVLFLSVALAIILWVAALFIMPGFFIVQPNEARVLVFFGKYIGTARDDGFHWANPFAIKKHVSLRVRNFNSERLKVNDAAGNPIEIAAVVVWRVTDSAKALFDVEKYENFVAIQSETALRTMAMHYFYDSDEQPGDVSLRGNPDEVADSLRKELHVRLSQAGVEVMEARISHLAYAPEIAQAMLRRQQAQAVISARKKIVDGAVGMVEMALHRLSSENIVALDEEKKATMVNNLLVALVSEQATQPIINTGTVY
ncbi:MAG: SPFH domain-containing protein [Ignavibacteriae bacterium]|nr:SPFH domain-containing protein [Ignavibacteriota bacterium]